MIWNPLASLWYPGRMIFSNIVRTRKSIDTNFNVYSFLLVQERLSFMVRLIYSSISFLLSLHICFCLIRKNSIFFLPHVPFDIKKRIHSQSVSEIVETNYVQDWLAQNKIRKKAIVEYHKNVLVGKKSLKVLLNTQICSTKIVQRLWIERWSKTTNDFDGMYSNYTH